MSNEIITFREESIINSIKERIKEIEPNLENLGSKDFNSLTTIELILKEIDIYKN